MFEDMDLIQKLIMVVLGVNMALGLSSQFLGWLKDKTKSTADDKAYEAVNKLISMLKFVVDIVGSNQKVKE